MNSTDDARSLYLDLMKKCSSSRIYGEVRQVPIVPRGFLKRKLVEACQARGLRVVQSQIVDAEARTGGREWLPEAHTMIGIKRLDNLQFCVEDVLNKGVPGDLIETGVWRGGATIFMRAILKAHGVTDRRVWVADSFEGLPAPNADQYPDDAGDVHHTYDELAIGLKEVKSNFEKYGLLDEQVCFLKGWFSDTLPQAPIKQLAIARLDGDMYESTMDALTALYPKLSAGGYLIVDDYGVIDACRKAVHDYRDANGISEKIHDIDGVGVFWQRAAANSAGGAQ